MIKCVDLNLSPCIYCKENKEPNKCVVDTFKKYLNKDKKSNIIIFEFLYSKITHLYLNEFILILEAVIDKFYPEIKPQYNAFKLLRY